MQYETSLDQKKTTLTLLIKRVRHLEYTEEIYRTEFPYSDIAAVSASIHAFKWLNGTPHNILSKLPTASSHNHLWTAMYEE